MNLTKRVLNRAAIPALVLAASACGGTSGDGSSDEMTADDVMRETKEAVSTAAEAASQERREFMSDARSKMDALNERMSTVRSEWRLESEDVRQAAADRWDQTFESLDRQRAEAADMLDRMQDASGPAWNDLREGFSDAHAEISAALDDAEAAIEKSADDQGSASG